METDRMRMLVELSAKKPGDNGYFYADIELPAMEEDITDTIQRLRGIGKTEDFYESSVSNCPRIPELEGFSLKKATLEELDFFARRLDVLADEDCLLLRGLLQYRIGKEFYIEGIPMKELINLTYGLDRMMIASNVRNDAALGEFVMDNELNEDLSTIPKTSRYLVNIEKVGKWQRENDGGVFVDGHYIVTGDYELPEIYDGIHLPKEFPETEDGVFRLLIAPEPVKEPEGVTVDGEWIALPMTEEETARILQAYQVQQMGDFVFYDFKSAVPRIDQGIFDDMKNFAALNQTAERYCSMTVDDQVKFKAVLQAQTRLDLAKILDITEHLPEYELSYLSGDADDFFKEYISHHLEEAFDRTWLENIVPHPDSQKLLGRLGAVQTDYGIISARGQSLYKSVSYEEPQAKELTSQALTDEKLEVVEVLGQTALFANGRVTEQEVPEGLYRYDLREGENISFSSIEKHVLVNHGGTILTKAPLDFGGQEYFVFDDDTSPNFLGYELTPDEFLQTGFTENDEEQESLIPQTGGMQL